MTLMHSTSIVPGTVENWNAVSRFLRDRPVSGWYTAAMHWFWRAFVAILAAWVAARVLGLAIVEISAWWGNRMAFLSWAFAITHLMELIMILAIYGLLTRRYYALQHFERETRCRQCGYILRGISEPRCPECGERI